MTDVVDASLATPRLTGSLLSIFAALALVLARDRRRRACSRTWSAAAAGRSGSAWRWALRARTSSALVLRRGLAYAGAGIAAGVAAALFLTRLMEGLLYGVAPRDPRHLPDRQRGPAGDRGGWRACAGSARGAGGSAGGAAGGLGRRG